MSSRWTRERFAALAGAVLLTIALPIAIDQGYVRYNPYILPSLGAVAALLYLGFFLTSDTFIGNLRNFQVGLGRSHPSLAFVLILGFYCLLAVGFYFAYSYALTVSKAHVEETRRREQQPVSRPKQPAKDQPETKEGTLQVQFKMLLLDTTNNKFDTSPLWVLYRGTYGQMVSPVALLVFFEVSSSYSYPVNISSYSMMMHSTHCEWPSLTWIDSRTTQLLWAYDGLDKAILLGENNSYDTIWQHPIPAYGTQIGFLIFRTSSVCRMDAGDHVLVQLNVKDRPPYISPEFTVTEKVSLDNSTGEANRPMLSVLGYLVDASKAYKQTDGAAKRGARPNELGKDAIFTRVGNGAGLALIDGAFMIRRRH